MPRDIVYGSDARNKILTGVKKLSKTVGITLGPNGRNVILPRAIGAPVLTKDGVSVAREVVLRDPYEEMGCQLVKEVAGRTAHIAGDGTTTATVLAEEILIKGYKLIEQGYSPIRFKQGLDWALAGILKEIDAISQPIEDLNMLKHIATISANNDEELGENIANAFDMAGEDGMVLAQAVPGVETHVKVVDGIEFNSGYISQGFVEKGQSKVTLDNCLILVCDRDITHLADNANLFNQISASHQPLFILAKDVKKEALEVLLVNNQKGRLRVCACKMPSDGFGKGNRNQDQWLEDLAIMTGTEVISEERGRPLSQLTIENLGFAKKVIIDRYKTKIIDPTRNEELVTSRINQYKDDLNKLLGDTEREDIENRMSFLRGRGTVLVVGYATELELRQTGDRIDDAMAAVRAALDSGIVPGGGTALIRAARNINLNDAPQEIREAAGVLIEACDRPFRQILINAGEDADAILEKIIVDNKNEFQYGYNAVTLSYGNLIEMGVIDPKKVTKTALINATSIANLLLRTDAIIAEFDKNVDGWQPPAGYRSPDNKGYDHKY